MHYLMLQEIVTIFGTEHDRGLNFASPPASLCFLLYVFPPLPYFSLLFIYIYLLNACIFLISLTVVLSTPSCVCSPLEKCINIQLGHPQPPVGTVMVHLTMLVFSILFCKSNHSAAGHSSALRIRLIESANSVSSVFFVVLLNPLFHDTFYYKTSLELLSAVWWTICHLSLNGVTGKPLFQLRLMNYKHEEAMEICNC